MTAVDLVLQERHLEELRGFLLRSDGVEASAYILCGQASVSIDPWDNHSRRRLLSYAVFPVPVSYTHLTLPTNREV